MAILLRVLLVSALLAASDGADVIIMHPPGCPTAATGSEIRAMFIGRRTVWPDGRSVMVVAAIAGPGHDGLMGFLGKSSQQFLNGWKKLMFTGNGTMPRLVAGDQEVAAYVVQTPGAIGLITGAPPAGVVVLLTLDGTTSE